MEYSAGTSGKNESENGNVALDESKGNDKNDDMNSHSLRIAAKNDNSERIKKLLYEGADLETLKEATNNNSETIRMLSRNDTDTTDLQTALFQCVAEKDPESIVVLLLNYNYIEYEDDKKNLKKDCITPTINLAAQLGHYEVIDEIAHFLIQSKYVDREFPPDFDYYKNWIENWDPGKGEWDVVDEEEWDQFDEMSFGEFLLQRQSAISRFRVLSSPVHMSLR